MTFAHPWMLLGAGAALIPLLVHLFDRRRPRPHPFGAISFVLKSQRRTASRLKLKRLLLYLLRTLILLALPIALARPELGRASAVSGPARGPSATAIILDASLSMRFSDGTSLFERGKDEARDALRDLLPEEPATVLLCTGSPTPPAAPGFDRGRLRSQVEDATASYAPADLNRCLELAARAVEESPLPGKRLVVVSDFTANGLSLERPAPSVKGPNGLPQRPDVVVRDVARGADELQNRAIGELKIEPALQVGPRAFQFSFTVRNFSTQAVKDLEATLRVGDRVVAKGFVDLAAGGTAQKTLAHRFDEGGTFRGEVTIFGDGLAEDDRRPFVVTVPRELKALVVNGAPNTVRYRDEAFFVDAALTAPGSPVVQLLRDPDSAWREDLAQFDLVMLLNVADPPAEAMERLHAFVQRGGGLFVSMGDQVNPEVYNQRLDKLLPRRLRLPKTAATRDEPDADRKASRLQAVKVEHPVFAPFTGRAGEGLLGSRFYRYMLLEAESVHGAGKGGAGSASEVLATFDDGAPALAVSRHGKGRVVLFTSTVDRDWSDFSIRTSFLPLLQRMAAYLCGGLDEREDVRVRIGERLVLLSDGTEAAVAVKTPGGETLAVEAQPDGTRAAGPILEPGVHEVLDSSDKPLPQLAFAAVLDPSESDLSRVRTAALEGYFGEGSVHASNEASQAPRVPLWTWLILLAVVAFFFEGVLLRR